MKNLNESLNKSSKERQLYLLRNLSNHLASNKNLDRLWRLLTNLYYLTAKCIAGMVYNLLSDYEDAVAVWPEDVQEEKRKILLAIEDAYPQEVQHFTQFESKQVSIIFSDFIFQQLRNRVYRNTVAEIDLTNHLRHDSQKSLLHRRPLRPTHFMGSIRSRPGSNRLAFFGDLRFLHDGQSLIAATVDEQAPRINTKTGEITSRFNCFGRALTLDITLDDTKVVFGGDLGSGSKRGFLEVFDVNSNTSLASSQIPHSVLRLVLTRNDEVVCLCADSKIRVYSINNILTPSREWYPHDRSGSMTLVISRDGILIATGELHGEKRPSMIKIWDAVGFELITEFQGPYYGITSLAFSSDSRMLLSGSAHLPNGVVAWLWWQGESEANHELLFRRDLIRDLPIIKEVSRESSIVGILETEDTVPGVKFIPNTSWVVAVEGSHEHKSNCINIFDLFSQENKIGESRSIAKITGHPNVPVAVEVDNEGRYIATLNASGEIYLWPVQGLENLNPVGAPPTLMDHTVDSSLSQILSRTEGYGFLYLTSTNTGITRPEPYLPSHGACLSPSGEFLIRTYWKELPVNPYSFEYPDNTELPKNWFKEFKSTTPCCCFLESVEKNAKQNLKLAGWELEPNLTTLKIVMSPREEWGAVLFENSSRNEQLLLCFSIENEKSFIHTLPIEFHASKLSFMRNDQQLLITSQRNNEFFLLDVSSEEWKPIKYYAILDLPEKITHGPFLYTDDPNYDMVIVVHSEKTVQKMLGYDMDLNCILLPVDSYKHDLPIADICMERDGRIAIISDVYPSITIVDMWTKKRLCWRPMDQLCTKLVLSQDEQRLLAIGKNSEVTGLYFSLMDIPGFERISYS